MVDRFNYNKLYGLIREKYKTQSNFAQALGISTSALSDRLANTQPFSQKEILKAKELLDLDTPEKLNAVFFTLY